MPEEQLPALAESISNRKFGVGGDGLLAFGWWEHGLKMRMFNPDGTEDFCGNGLRCAAWVGHRLGWVKDRFSIAHHGRIVSVQVQGREIRTVIGKGDYAPDQVPVCFPDHPQATFHREALVTVDGKSYRGSALSTGSTHVILRPGLPASDEEFTKVSQAIENSPSFPERTSVIWRESSGPNDVKIRIWERGAGETLGCGTGSAATAVEIMRERDFGGKIAVHNPGGTVWVEGADWQSELTVVGEAETVYRGTYDWNF